MTEQTSSAEHVPVVCKHCSTPGRADPTPGSAVPFAWSKRVCLKRQHQPTRKSYAAIREGQADWIRKDNLRIKEDKLHAETERVAQIAAHAQALPQGPRLGRRRKHGATYELRASTDAVWWLVDSGDGIGPSASRLVNWGRVANIGLQDTSRMTVTRLLAFGIAAGGMRKAQTLVVFSLSDGKSFSVLLDGHEVQVRGAFNAAAALLPPLAPLLQ